MALVYLSLGSNIGDRVAYIQQAVKLLQNDGMLTLVRSSTLYETEPWGNKEQNWFINAVIEAKTQLLPQELLKYCQEIEAQLGRMRSGVPRWGERTIDIDILFYDDKVINTPELTIPHKYLHERAFTLVPLLELVPSFKHPVLGKTILELHEALEKPEDVFLYGTVNK